MQITTRYEQGVPVLQPLGMLDRTAAGEVKRSMQPYRSREGSKLIVDMGSLNYIDSWGVGALVSEIGHLLRNGGDLLIANLQGQPREVFRKANLHLRFKIFPTVAEAAEYVNLKEQEKKPDE